MKKKLQKISAKQALEALDALMDMLNVRPRRISDSSDAAYKIVDSFIAEHADDEEEPTP